jgi:exonuclease III
MVESRTDKNRLNASMIPRRERELFEAIKRTLHVEDNPRTPGSLKFSWDNGRASGIISLARLDRVYVFPSLPTSPSRTIFCYEIRRDMVRSDHCPVVISLQLAEQPPEARHWKMSS